MAKTEVTIFATGYFLNKVSTKEKMMDINPESKTKIGGKKRNIGIILKIKPIFNIALTPSGKVFSCR